MAALLAYFAGAIVASWGVVHAIPTRLVLAGFAPMTADKRRVLAQEWVAEAFIMWGIATLVIVVSCCWPQAWYDQTTVT
jgi:hypothetical protein